MSNGKGLVGPQGQQLIKEPNFILIKIPANSKFNPRSVEGIAKVTGCSVIALPMNVHAYSGLDAVEQLKEIHSTIHQISSSPDITFTPDNLATLHAMCKYVVEQTQPGDDSKEVKILKALGGVVNAK